MLDTYYFIIDNDSIEDDNPNDNFSFFLIIIPIS